MNVKYSMVGFLASLCIIPAFASPQAPEFSDGMAEHWHYIVFQAGGAVLLNQGMSVNAVTAVADPSKESQLWKFVGNQDDFIIVNKRDGEYIMMKSYVNATNNEQEASHFRLVPSANQTYADSWEIEFPEAQEGANRWTQWYKTGPGVNIGLGASGASNNAITFIPEGNLPEIPPYVKIKEFASSPVEGYVPDHRNTIWFDQPAASTTAGDPWMEYALPIGNGRLGAMVFGGVAQDHIQFNDKSLWCGNTTTRGSYCNFGDLYVEDISGVFGESSDKALNSYMRNLDLSEAKANVSFLSPDGGTGFTREYIASFPDNVVAMRYASTGKGKISLRIRLFNGVMQGMLRPEYKDGSVSFSGLLDLVSFRAQVKAVPTGGKMTTHDDCIEVTDADELLLILAASTNYDIHSPAYIGSVESMASQVETDVENAAQMGWDMLLDRHIKDYKEYYDRAAFVIDAAENTVPTNKMVTKYNSTLGNSRLNPTNLMLEELYYAYGRYLLMASSRGMDLPANLQGIWNNTNKPAWQCDIHSNINVQMNYWPAETTNLSEMHMPYLNYIHAMALEHGEWQEYARRSGQSKGWTCFTQNNIFGHSDYAENYVIANAWYCTHLWQHYVFTQDRDFLRDTAMPVIKSCAEFWLERLTMDKDGKWVAPDEWSPEHGPSAENATAHAQQIIHELFRITQNAIEILGDDAEVSDSFISELADKFQNLDLGLATEEYTGVWGEESNGVKTGDLLLREWKYSDYSVGEKEHRHQSHLMAMYPFGNISPESEWFQPAVNSLTQRGDVSTGWSLAWRLALWARAQDGQHAAIIITKALRHASSYGQSNGAGGIYYNLLDSHSPFQIDGNFGYTAGVTEMLVQSYGDVIRFLPALSPYWASGSIRGIKAEGNFEIDQQWSESRLTAADVISLSGLPLHLNYAGIGKAKITADDGSLPEIEVVDNDNVKFPTVAGVRYTVEMPDAAGAAYVEGEGSAPVYYNLQGVRVANPENGIFIVREGSKTSKKVF